jgi:Cu/Ag efflux protein CusF
MQLIFALTIEANAMGSGISASRSAVERENGLLGTAQAQQGETRKTFRGVGVVTATEPAGSLTINHEAIQELMPAMEMMFTLNPRSLSNGVHPGDKVEFSIDGKTYAILDLHVRGHIR